MAMSELTLATTRRMFARMAAIGALALFLGALLAIPASAFDRRDAVVLANQFIDRCFAEGGEPIVLDVSEDSVRVACKNGSKLEVCYFWPQGYCHKFTIFPPHDPGTHDPIPDGGGILDGKSAQAAAGAALIGDERARGHKQHKHRHHHNRRR